MFDALRRLFGGAGAREAPSGVGRRSPPVPYKDFMIHPAPRREGGQWLTAGVITKQGPDGEREAAFIRSDQFSSKEDAENCAVAKARQIIDERGDRLFDREWP